MGKQWIWSVALCCALVTTVGAEEREQLLVIHEDEGVVTILEPSTGEVQGMVRVGLGPHEVAVSPSGTQAVVTNYGLSQGGSSLSLIDVEGRRLLRTIPLTLEEHRPELGRIVRTFRRPHGICYTRDPSRVLVTCEAEQALLLVDVEKACVLAAIDTGQELSRQVLLDHDGFRVFVSNEGSGSISVIDLGRRRLIETIEAGGGAQGMALHPTKNELWIANYGTNSISVIDTQALKEIYEFPCGTCPVRLAFTADAAQVMCVNYQGGSLSVFDSVNRRLVREVGLARLDDEQAAARPLGPGQRGFGRSAMPLSLRLSPDGSTAWVTCTRIDRLAEIDVANLQVRRYLKTGSRTPLGLGWASFEDDVARAK